MKACKHIALLLAGGKSSRMNTSLPKQYVKVDGESILQHTMKAFERHPLISSIYVVCAHEWKITVEQEAKEAGISKFCRTIVGGDTSFGSIMNGIECLLQEDLDKDSVVLVHDAVRPLISQSIISNNIAVCLTFGNAITAIESQEAFMQTEDGCISNAYLPRHQLLRAQTPHTFRLKTLKEMMERARTAGVTNSQSLYTLANELGFTPLHIAKGSMLNFKLTYPSDLQYFQALKELQE